MSLFMWTDRVYPFPNGRGSEDGPIINRPQAASCGAGIGIARQEVFTDHAGHDGATEDCDSLLGKEWFSAIGEYRGFFWHAVD
jgi:hypothetical protein